MIGSPGDGARTIRTVTPDGSDPTVLQVATLAIGEDRHHPFLWCRRGLTSTTPALVGTVGFAGTAPQLFTDLMAHVSGDDHGWPITGRPEPFDRAAIEALLRDPRRRLPVVAVLEGSGVDADELAGALAGLDHVINVARRASELPPELNVGIGGAVLWWPGWPAPGTHQRWQPEELVDRFGSGWPLIRTLCAASAFRIPEPPVLARLAHNEARRRIERARTSSSGSIDLDEWERDLVELGRVRVELEAATTEVAHVRDDNNAILAAWDSAVADGVAAVVDHVNGTEPEFATVADVLAWADENLVRVDVSPEAHKTGADSPYRWPGRLAAALRTLDRLAADWANDQLANGFSIAAGTAGLPWRAEISDTAATKYAEDYLATTPDGTVVTCGPHLAWGANTGPAGHLRCYLYLNRDRRRIVVGPTGRHGRGQRNS